MKARGPSRPHVAPRASTRPHVAPRASTWSLVALGALKSNSLQVFIDLWVRFEIRDRIAVDWFQTQSRRVNQPRGQNESQPRQSTREPASLRVGLWCSTGAQTKSQSLYIKKCIHPPDRPPHGAATRKFIHVCNFNFQKWCTMRISNLIYNYIFKKIYNCKYQKWCQVIVPTLVNVIVSKMFTIVISQMFANRNCKCDFQIISKVIYTYNYKHVYTYNCQQLFPSIASNIFTTIISKLFTIMISQMFAIIVPKRDFQL